MEWQVEIEAKGKPQRQGKVEAAATVSVEVKGEKRDA